MKIISMKQLRENFTPIRDALLKGEKFLLLYRSKPLAILSPYQEGQIKTNKTSSKIKVKAQKKRQIIKKKPNKKKLRAEFAL